MSSFIPQQVRDLGRKARARLEEERSKRREIQTVHPTEIATAAKKSTLVAAAKKKKAPNPTKPAQQQSKRKRRRSADKNNNKASVEDPWMPDISHLFAEQQGKKSNVIQLHGVPVTTTVASIRRFLSGLEPFQIGLLVFPAHSISVLDAKEDRDDEDHLVPRCCHRDVRILVQFTTAAVAKLATNRSGETMENAAIAITPLGKRLGHYLVDKLAVPWEDTTTTTPLTTVASQLFAQLERLRIPEILWSAAERDLRGILRTPTTESPFSVARHDGNKQLSAQQAQQLRDQRQLFQEQAEKLRSTLPIVVHDASLFDPVSMLTQSSIQTLEENRARIQQSLHISAKWDHLLSLATVVEENTQDTTAQEL